MERFGLSVASNNVKTSVNIPTINRENRYIYINDLKMWQFVTGVNKQVINDTIGMDDLRKRWMEMRKELEGFLFQEEMEDDEEDKEMGTLEREQIKYNKSEVSVGDGKNFINKKKRLSRGE